MSGWTKLYAAFHAVGTPRMLIGTQLVRFSLGLTIVYTYVLHYQQRHFLWGPDGVWPLTAFNASDLALPLSLYAVNESSLFFEVVFHLGIVSGFCFALGIAPRIIGPINLISVWSLQERNPYVLDGGDNILRLTLLYLLFARVTGQKNQGDEPDKSKEGPSIRGALHNMAVLAVIVQLSMVYLSTGLYKVMGEMWQNGTALYYVMRVNEFTWPGYSEWIYRNHYLVVLFTYGTVLFEISFPFLLLNRFTRWAAIASGICFHVGIGLFMGLVTFAWTMISLYAVLVSDDEYRALAVNVRARRSNLARHLKRWLPGVRAGSVQRRDRS